MRTIEMESETMAFRRLGRILVLLTALVSLTSARLLRAGDVILDGSLGTAGSLRSKDGGGRFAVDESLGMRSGPNLYHSFSKFDLDRGEVAEFRGSPSVRNVISRVTGGSPSTISGTIISDIRGANFFFVNPAGIVFTENAQLQIDGSFHATTANFLEFGDSESQRFPAVARPEPLLSSDPVSAFGFLKGHAVESIEVKGTQLEPSGSSSFVKGDLSFIGGNLVFDPSSRLEIEGKLSLASFDIVATDARIGISEDPLDRQFTVSGAARLGRIDVQGGLNAGGIQVRARELDVTGRMLAALGPEPRQDAENWRRLRIDLDERLALSGGGRIFTGLDSAGRGKEGSISVSVGASKRDGTIELEGSGSRIAISQQGHPLEGNLELRAGRILLKNDAQIRAVGIREGMGSGQGGQIVLDADRLVLAGGGAVRTGAIGSFPEDAPDASGISVHARDVLITGRGMEPSQLHSGRNGGLGRGGDIEIHADRLTVADGAQISTETSDGGAAGNLVLDVDRLNVVSAEILTRSEGSAPASGQDSVRHIADELLLKGRSSVGDGGNISIGPGQLLSVRDGEIHTDGIVNGGNITVASETTVLNRSTISAAAKEADGGNVQLQSPFLLQDSVSRIDASSQKGKPGEIDITGPELSLVGDLAELPATFLAAQKLLRPQCAVRDPDASGSFVVTQRGGVASAPDGWLVAFAGDDPGVLEEPPPVAAGPPGGGAVVAEARARVTRGWKALRSGNLTGARQEFEAASEAAQGVVRSGALRGAAQAEQAAGDYRAAVRNLLQALLIAEDAGDAAQVASLLGSLGNAYVALEAPEEAQDHLQRGLAVARRAAVPGVEAEIQINLGNFEAMRGHLDAALDAYRGALESAQRAGRTLYALQALANGARVSVQARRPLEAARMLEEAGAWVAALPASNDKIDVLIHLARTEVRAGDGESEQGAQHMLRAHGQLMTALKLAQELRADRASSYALGALGALYERDHRYTEALEATQRGVLAAEQADAPESLYRLHDQAGRLLARLGRREASLEAYRRAKAIVERLRPEAAYSYARETVSFRGSVSGVYRSLVAELLEEAAAQSDPGEKQRFLREARETEEAMRQAELRDYFRDECVAELARRDRPVESLDPRAAVVYPVLLPDRTELLVSIGGVLRNYPVPAPAQRVELQAVLLREALRDPKIGTSYREPARQLYDWLVKPYAADLEAQGIETLVFVPDGVLRTIPISALHDGHDFLVRRYAVAVTPGLQVTDPRPIEREQLKLLASGLSHELPEVAHEIEAIRSGYPSTVVLLDEKFTKANFESQLSSQNFSIVHIASHAALSGDSRESFVLAQDAPISLRELGDWVGRTRFRDRPIDLLVLSGCETAAGDDRAALGLAGMAVRAGARSALGSLWSVDDRATAQLMKHFYENLRGSQESRAQALRRAQLSLLDEKSFENPAYWAAFLLMNSWL